MLLLDTNVVSELRRVRIGKADPNVVRWVESVDAVTLFISAITVHELELGVLLAERRDPPQGAALRLRLDTQVIPAFEERILPVDAAVGRQAADVTSPIPAPSTMP